MKKLLTVLIILNFIFLLPRIINHWPFLITKLRGDLRAGNRQDLNDLLEAFDWLNAHKEKGVIRQDAVVVCRKPQHCYYYSGLKSINFPFTEKKDSVFAAITKAELVVALNDRGTSMAFLNPVLMDSAKYFRILYDSGGEIPNVMIFAVEKNEVAKLLQAKP